MDDLKLKRKKLIYKIIISIICLILIALFLIYIYKKIGLKDLTVDSLRNFIESKGIVAPLIFIIVTFAQVTLIPIPSTITVLTGNLLFGPWLSFLYSYIGMILGSLFAFFLGKKLGRKFINWIAGDIETVDKYLLKLKGKEKIVIFFMFLFPFFPDDLLCSIAGILPITFFEFSIMQLLTRFTSIGATLLFMSGEIIPYDGWGIVIIILFSILGIIAFIISMKKSEQINAFLKKLITKNKNESNKD